MQLKTVGQSINALNSIQNILNNTSLAGTRQNIALTNSLKIYSIETVKAAIVQGTFTEEQIRAILSAKGLTEAEIEEFIATNALSGSQAGATASTLGLGTAFKGLGIAIKNTTKAMWTWLATTPAGWVTAAIAATVAWIYALYKLHDALTVTLEEQQELTEELLNDLSEIQSEISDVDSEMQTIAERIEELNALDHLSFVERDELDRLIKENELLKDRNMALKEQQRIKQQEVADSVAKEFEKEYGNKTYAKTVTQYSQQQMDEMAEKRARYEELRLNVGYNTEEETAEMERLRKELEAFDSATTSFEGHIQETITSYEELNKRKEDGEELTEKEEKRLEEYRAELVDLALDMEDYIDRYGLDDETSQSWRNLSDSIYAALYPPEYLTKKFDTVFESLSKNVQSELEELAENGSLSVENLTDDIIEKFSDAGFTAQEIIDQIYSKFKKKATREAKDASNISISDIFALEDAEGNATALKELSDQLSEVEDAYNTCLSAKEEFDEQGYLSIDTLQKVLALGDDYLQYLFDEEGNVRLDAEAFQELTLARINDMEAQALNNLASQIEQIQNEANATDYLTQKQNDLAASYADVAANALYAMTQISGFANSAPLQNAYNSFVTQYERIKSLFTNTRSGITTTYSGKSSSSSSASSNTSETDWKSILDSETDLLEKQLEAGLITFDEYVQKRRDIIEKYYRDNKISAKDYYDALEDMYDYQLDIYDKVLSAIERRFDKEIDRIQDVIDAIEKQNEVLEKQKDQYDSILSVVDSVYEKEIERIQAEQDAIQDTIDALQDENDERKLALQLEQAKWELYRAQHQRTKKIYNGTEFIYDTDKDAIREAQENLADLTLEQTVDGLEKEKDALDAVIEELEKYRDLWAEIPDTLENAENEQLAIALWGKDYERVILSNRISDIESFKNNYVFIQEQINDNQTLIDSYNEKVEYYEKLKDQWSDITDAYENAMEDQYAAMILGANWESDILDGRLDVLNNFKNEYIAIQNAIAEAAKNSAQAQAAAQSSGSSGGSTGSGGTGSGTGIGANSTGSGEQANYRVVDADTSTVYVHSSTKSACEKYISSHNLKIVSTIGTTFMVKKSGGSTGGTGTQKTMMAYASGTEHAKRGLNLVGEKGAETLIDNDGNVSLVTEPSLIPMQGGETVKNAKETKELLNSDNIVPVDSPALANFKKEITNLDLSDLEQRVRNVMPSYSSMIQLPVMDMPSYDYSVTRNETTPVVQHITLTLPNVTNESGYERIVKELRQAQLDARQYAYRR